MINDGKNNNNKDYDDVCLRQQGEVFDDDNDVDVDDNAEDNNNNNSDGDNDDVYVCLRWQGEVSGPPGRVPSKTIPPLPPLNHLLPIMTHTLNVFLLFDKVG